MEGADAPTELDRIRDGLTLFNEEFFFEAHEVLEDVWRKEHGEPRLFLQGLIQLCAGLHHFQNGNYGGAAALLQRGADKMRRYPERYIGLEAADVIVRIDACREQIEKMRLGSEPAGPIQFPKIHFDS